MMAGRISGAIAATVGLIVLVGWALDLALLTSIRPGWPPMAPGAALCFVLIGLALAVVPATPPPPSTRQPVARAALVAVAVIGLLRLAAYLSGTSSGLDGLWFGEGAQSARMSPATASTFAALACARLARDWNLTVGFRALAVFGGLTAWLGLSQYCYGIVSDFAFSQMALHTSVLLVLLAVGLLAERPDLDPVRMLTTRTSGGAMARRLAPAAVFTQLGLGWLLMRAHRAGWVETGAGASLFTLIALLILGTLVWTAVRSAHRADLERREAEDAITRVNAALERRVQERTRQLAQFKAALDHHALVAVTDADGRMTYANDQLCAISQHTRKELIGQDHRILGRSDGPNDAFQDLCQTINGFAVWKGEVENRAKDGTRYWVATTVVPFLDEQGTPLEYIAIRTDITKRKAAEAKLEENRAVLRHLFRSLPGAFLVLTPAFRIVGASDAYLAATGFTRRQIVGRDLFGVFAERYGTDDASWPANLRVSLERVLHTGVADVMAIQKYGVVRADSVFEERYWSPLNSPVLGPDGQLERIIHRVEDVTDFVRQTSSLTIAGSAEGARLQQIEAAVFQSSQRLESANRQLEIANRELESFSYSVSHDLRAPLRHVQGYVELLEQETHGQLSEKGRRYVRAIAEASSQMGQLIDDLLAFSRMTRTRMHASPVDMNVLVEETIRKVSEPTRHRTIDWQVAPLPQVVGDPAMLGQVFMNLIDNAVKYSRQREPARIEIGSAGEENGRVVLFVRDNGAGFDMQYAGKLFGVFQRLHRADEFEGTGIGLATVQRVVARHGGRVWAEATPDEGATFFVTLERSA